MHSGAPAANEVYFEICCPSDGTWRVCPRKLTSERASTPPHLQGSSRGILEPLPCVYAPGITQARTTDGRSRIERAEMASRDGRFACHDQGHAEAQALQVAKGLESNLRETPAWTVS